MRLVRVSDHFWLFNVLELPVANASNGLDRHVPDWPMGQWIGIFVVNPVACVQLLMEADLNGVTIKDLDGLGHKLVRVAERMT